MVSYSYDHIHLRSPDPEKTAAYYERMFGARIIKAPQGSGPGRIDLDLNGLTIFVAGPPASGAYPEELPDEHYGLDHFGLRVDDMDSAASNLKAKGAEFALEPKQLRPGVKIAFLRAPDGVRIELLERRPA